MRDGKEIQSDTMIENNTIHCHERRGRIARNVSRRRVIRSGRSRVIDRIIPQHLLVPLVSLILMLGIGVGVVHAAKDVALPDVELRFSCSSNSDIVDVVNNPDVHILTGFYHDLLPQNLDIVIEDWTQQQTSDEDDGIITVEITSKEAVATFTDSAYEVIDERRIYMLVTPERLSEYFAPICEDMKFVLDGTKIEEGQPPEQNLASVASPNLVVSTTSPSSYSAESSSRHQHHGKTHIVHGDISPLAIDNVGIVGITVLCVVFLFCVLPAILVCVCSGDLPRRIQRRLRPQLYVKGLKKITDNSPETVERLEIICRSGVKYRSSEIGCYALDETDYSDASPIFPLFEYVALEYHRIPQRRGFKEMPPTGIHSQLDWGDPSAHRLPMAEDFLGFAWRFSQGILAHEPGRFQSVRVSITRNLAGFPFPAGLTQERRTEIAKMVKAALQLDTFGSSSSSSSPTGSKTHSPSSESSSKNNSDDDCPWIFEDFSKRQDLWPIDKFRELRAAGIAQQWPLNRFVATKQCEGSYDYAEPNASYDEEKAQLLRQASQSFIQVMVNGEDHIKIVVSNPRQLSSADDVIRTVSELARAEQMLAAKLRQAAPQLYGTSPSIPVYAYNNHFGFLTSSPANLGSTFQITVIDGLDIRESTIELYKPVLETIEEFFDEANRK